MDYVKSSGFGAEEDVVHLFIGGSELHGAKVGATDDLDIYGVYIEPPELALGLTSREHFVWSTAGDERRNGPEDVDVTLYVAALGGARCERQCDRVAFCLRRCDCG